MSREIFFSKTGDSDWEHNVIIPFGLYSLLLYYSSNNSSSGGELLFNASISEWYYRHINNLSKNGLTVNDYEAHFGHNDIQSLLNYLNNQLIPALNNETEGDIVSGMYGGLENYYELFNNATNYLKEFGLFENDLYGYYVSEVIDIAIELRDFFQRVKDNNMKYEVSVE